MSAVNDPGAGELVLEGGAEVVLVGDDHLTRCGRLVHALQDGAQDLAFVCLGARQGPAHGQAVDGVMVQTLIIAIVSPSVNPVMQLHLRELLSVMTHGL